MDQLENELKTKTGAHTAKSIDDSFINTNSHLSMTPNERSLGRNKTPLLQTVQSQHQMSHMSLKQQSIEDQIKHVVSSLNLINNTSLKQSIDKLGEEIAFDINQFETTLNLQKKEVQELKLNMLDLKHEKENKHSFVQTTMPKVEITSTKSISGSLSEDKIKQLVRHCIADLKYQHKKQRDDLKYIFGKYEGMR